MDNMMKSFRFKMIALFALSMVLAATVTYIIYKGLQLYYKTMVRYEEPLAQFRSIVREFGDINFFLIFFIRCLLSFSSFDKTVFKVF